MPDALLSCMQEPPNLVIFRKESVTLLDIYENIGCHKICSISRIGCCAALFLVLWRELDRFPRRPARMQLGMDCRGHGSRRHVVLAQGIALA